MIFVDTWAWIALADKTDQYHSIAVAEHQKLAAARRAYVTSDYVLTEYINYLYSSISPDRAEAIVDSLFHDVVAGTVRLVHVTPEQFEQAWQLRKKYHDKPDISFIDFTSMAIMRDLSISEIFSGDAHFEHVGMGFRLVP
jgi:predicted nucleic acid-binding protein